jgi:deoxyribodipyrimidine photolyase
MKWGDEEVLKSHKEIHYPKPIVDYAKQKKIALQMYNSIFH